MLNLVYFYDLYCIFPLVNFAHQRKPKTLSVSKKHHFKVACPINLFRYNIGSSQILAKTIDLEYT